MIKRRKKLLKWAAAGAGALAVGGVGGPFVYIHFIEGPAPAKLALPKLGARGSPASTGSRVATSTTSPPRAAAPADETLTAAPAVAGTWHVGSGSVVGYRVQEVLIGQNSTAVGRTSEVWGSLTIAGSEVVKASFTANMASVKSDQAERNAQFDGRIMDVAAYPTASFELTKPIALGSLPAPGKVERYQATGYLTMHGVSRRIAITVSAERTGSSLYVLSDINIVFADWKIQNPSVGGFVTTQSHGVLEVLLHLTKGTGNPAYNTTESQSAGANAFPAGGPGGQVTVPPTTVSPLTVPRG